MTIAVPDRTAGSWPKGTWLRRLGPDDLADVVSLHALLHDHSPSAGLFVRESDAFFAHHLGSGGLVLGLGTRDGELMAYSVLGVPDAEDPAHFGQMIGQSRQARRRTCHLDGTGIHPGFRGQGLQRLLTLARLDEARKRGRDIAISTVALTNPWSLLNLASAGLRVVALVEKYDSRRLVLVRDPCDRRVVLNAGPVVWVALDGASAGHRKALDQGLVGVEVARGPQGAALRYSPLSEGST